MTATTEVGLYNLALSLAGAKASVVTTTETSREAQQCALWYSEVRDLVLNAAPWPSLKSSYKLELVMERDTAEDWENYDPPEGMLYAYALPSNFLRARYLSTFERFTLGQDQSNVKRIFSNAANAVLVYSRTQTDITKWEQVVKMAIVHGLAAYIARPLTGKADLAANLIQAANDMLMAAKLEMANSEEAQFESTPDWIAARGYVGNAPSTRFVFPAGPLLTYTSAGLT